MVEDAYRGRRIRLSINMWLYASGKASLSLCSRVVSYIKRRALITSRRIRH
jgi:hypothetical protein